MTTPRCLNPLCPEGKKLYARGLCSACYNMACEMVRKGKTTWAELESLGKAGPSRRGQNQRVSRFGQWLASDNCELAEQIAGEVTGTGEAGLDKPKPVEHPE